MKNTIEDINTIKDIKKLIGAFDNVIHENLETHQTLELSNNVTDRGFIEKEVYLKIDISYFGNGGKSPKDCLEGAVKNINSWLDLLLNHDEEEKSQSSQLSLFGDDTNEKKKLEEPENPSSEGNWDKYFRTLYKVRKFNLMLDYKFFELFDPLCWWWSYHKFDYRRFIPTHEEMLTQLKEMILKYKNDGGRHNDAWFDNIKYITENEGLSDVELYNRVMRITRLYIKPWQRHSGVFYDDSYKKHSEPSSKLDYLFYFDGSKLSLNYSNITNYVINCENQKNSIGSHDLMTYNFYTPEFIAFLREVYEVRKIDSLDDEKAISCALENFAHTLNTDWNFILNSCLSYKEFKIKILDGANLRDKVFKNMSLHDDYVVNIIENKKIRIEVEQRTATREMLGYPIEYTDAYHWSYVVLNLEGDEIYKTLFEKYKTEEVSTVSQMSLFDFLGVA